MDSARLEIDLTSPFGKYSLHGRRKLAFNLTRKSHSKTFINIIRALGGLRSDKAADVEIYGGKMRLYPGANRSDKQMIAKSHIFDFSEREALSAHLKTAKNPSFIDIGANIGAYSIFVQGLRLNTKIIAIEADGEIFKRLQFNLPNAVKLNIAVASKEGVLPFYINEASRGQNSLVAGEGMQKIEVQAKRLLQILDENNITQPSALKIDVEGAELDIFSKFYEEAPPERWPEMVIMEYYHGSEVVNFLTSKGYNEILRTKMNTVLKLPPGGGAKITS